MSALALTASRTIIREGCTICCESFDKAHKPVKFSNCGDHTSLVCEPCAIRMDKSGKPRHSILRDAMKDTPSKFCCPMCRKESTTYKVIQIKEKAEGKKDDGKGPAAPLASRAAPMASPSPSRPFVESSRPDRPFPEHHRLHHHHHHHHQHVHVSGFGAGAGSPSSPALATASRLPDRHLLLGSFAFQSPSIPSAPGAGALSESIINARSSSTTTTMPYSLENLKGIMVNGKSLAEHAISAGLVRNIFGKQEVHVFLKDENLAPVTAQLKARFPSCSIEGNTFKVMDHILFSAM